MGDEQMLDYQSAEDAKKADASTAEEKEGAQGEQNQASKREAEKKYTDEDVDRIIAKKITAERRKMQKLFQEEQQESDLEIRERKVLERELKADAKDALIRDGFPSSLADVMTYSTKEACERSYKEITSVFREAMSKELKRRLGGPEPRAGASFNQDRALLHAFSPKSRQ
ncbi:Uncharacterised protein [uncultured Roseburia sp.]|uniref:DUF4355 domain-containing protein n=1 Tax=Brotonthovivens ammoniilytica TaxID=2981725 RepID=A0ABT2TIZ1_9FIRM|nr:DUF4355 domain-containing protein [Brotonthovivens ammoniilytica]MCU6762178.1 DUF4355 domain-containing protein [Brotonthovivens ammoniilytica]SCI57943.1 Uncharacterised protein [uncultured Roseburia sp.]